MTDIAVIIAAIPAALAAVVWLRGQLDRRRERQTARETRNWNGYISIAGIDTWYVKVIEDPDNKWTERVIM